jgi:hypothetical protein
MFKSKRNAHRVLRDAPNGSLFIIDDRKNEIIAPYVGCHALALSLIRSRPMSLLGTLAPPAVMCVEVTAEGEARLQQPGTMLSDSIVDLALLYVQPSNSIVHSP